MYYRIKSEWPQAKGMITTKFSSGFSDRKMAESCAAGHAKQGAVLVDILPHVETKEDIVQHLQHVVIVLDTMIKKSNTKKDFNTGTEILSLLSECLVKINSIGD